MTSRAGRGTDDVFAPPAADWTRVSPKLVTAHRISLGIWSLAIVAVIVALLVIPTVPRWIAAAVAVGWLALAAWSPCGSA